MLCAGIVVDLLIAFAVIIIVPYTEIDWRAYMQEVSGVLEDGQMDYTKLRGDTGPLVYPAGFVYVYSLLFYATDRGLNIARAQFIFAVLHAATLACAMYLYWIYKIDADSQANSRHSFPLWIVLFLLCSRRVMSLFVLRLFNDAIQSCLMYIAIILFATSRWRLGCLAFSASVSIKMNALLYSPAVAVLLCQALGPVSAFLHVALLCGGVQLLFGFPFLLHAPYAYISKAFEFSRVFEFKWSVNGAFFSEAVFLDKRVSHALLACHLITLLAFGHFRWTAGGGGGLISLVAGTGRKIGFADPSSLWEALIDQPRTLRPSHVIRTMFTCNLIGIVFARTLHYQFYIWYFHTLPLLVFVSDLPKILGFTLLAVVEVVFNIYPPRPVTSAALAICHLTLLYRLWRLPNSDNSDIFSPITHKNL